MWQTDVTGKRTAHGRLSLGLGLGRGPSLNVFASLISCIKMRLLDSKTVILTFHSASRAALAAGEWQGCLRFTAWQRPLRRQAWRPQPPGPLVSLSVWVEEEVRSMAILSVAGSRSAALKRAPG